MIKRCQAVRFDGSTESGQTKPLRISIQTKEEQSIDVIAKVSVGGACSVESLVNEMLGAILASDLDLPVCEPFLIDFKDDFVNSISDLKLKDRLRESNSLGFGSKYVGNQWRTWGVTDKLSAEQLYLATNIIAFDAFLDNGDRRPGNSNLLVKGKQLRLIDHEQLFSFLRLLNYDDPWNINSLSPFGKLGSDSEHVFYRQLSKKSGTNFTKIKENWNRISDNRLQEYENLLPNEWKECKNNFEKRISRIKSVRDRIDDCISELKRLLKNV